MTSTLARLFLALCLAALAFGTMAASPAKVEAESVVRFPGRAPDVDRRIEYAAELLALCLAKSGRPYRLELIDAMSTPRARGAAMRREVDVVVMPNTTANTGGLLPIRLPLRRGLLGVRLLLSRAERATALMDVESLDALKRDFRLGYGSYWMDRDTMQRLGFRMVGVDSYTGLFDGLRAGRFDYLSRGVNELAIERADPRLAGRDLVVVPGIALFYPLDHYFWVHPRNPTLAADIDTGFRRALADGSYAALFVRFHAEAMRDIRMHERSVIHVVDYPVPPNTPLESFDILELTSSRGSLVNIDDPGR